MKLHTLKPAKGSTHYRRRIGRGPGSGLEGTFGLQEEDRLRGRTDAFAAPRAQIWLQEYQSQGVLCCEHFYSSGTG